MAFLAIYKFTNSEVVNKASSKVSQECSGSNICCSYGDKLHINDSCSNPEKAAQICLTMGGECVG